MTKSIRIFPLVALAALAVASEYPVGSRQIWFEEPAADWNEALPIGNGRLGGMVFSGTEREHVQMNEDSIWSGGFQDRMNPAAADGFPKIRDMLVNEEITAAGQKVLTDMTGIPTSPRVYHPMADFFADFGHEWDASSWYKRLLDTSSGYVSNVYAYNMVEYNRQSFASFPAGVLYFRYMANETASISTTLSLYREQNVFSHTAEAALPHSSITLRAGSGQDDGINFTVQARINVEGDEASVSSNGTSVTIENADVVTVFVDAETSYRYETQDDWEAEMNRKLDNCTDSDYQELQDATLRDYGNLEMRVRLDLGDSGDIGELPTVQRLERYQQGDVTDDPELVVLMFTLGRHMLISSSRQENGDVLSLPANLQGVWNPSYDPPWGSKYTVNINTEMNYWPAEITNLAETHTPLFDLVGKILPPRARKVAEGMYSCPGILVHHNTDVWGDSVPVDNGTMWSMWPMGEAWLSLHLMEHYRFNGDKEFLESTALPVLQEVAEFYYCYLFEFEGYYSTGPSLSPENSFYTQDDQTIPNKSEGTDIAPTMDNEILIEVFSAILEAGEALGIDGSDERMTQASEYLDKIKPPQISESLGTIMEWRRDYRETELGHRHVSHLFGFYPGSSMTMAHTPELAAAVDKSLERRLANGGGATGWSSAWNINLFARLWQGDAAWDTIKQHLGKSTLRNLFNNDPFQADGNFGFTAGVAEMLVQSHAGFVHLLPALPAETPEGSVSGLMARGGFQVSIGWQDGQLSEAKIQSKLGNPLSLRVANEEAFKVDGETYSGPIETQPDQEFVITLS